MSGITFTVEITENEARAALGALLARMERPGVFYKRVGAYLTDEAVPRNFATETSPLGTPWAQLSPVTVARREASGQVPIRILRATNRLAASIVSQATETDVRVGSNVPYAGVMQMGAAQGAFGRTARGGPIPWGRIPARPYLGLSTDDEAEIIAIAGRWLSSG